MALNIIGRDILAFILSGHRTERQTEFFTFLVLFCIYMVGFLGWVSGLGFLFLIRSEAKVCCCF